MITCGAKNWSQLRIPNPSGQFAQRLLADSDVPTFAFAFGFALALALPLALALLWLCLCFGQIGDNFVFVFDFAFAFGQTLTSNPYYGCYAAYPIP